MSEKNPPAYEAHAEKPKEQGSEKPVVHAPINSHEDNAVQLRAEKRQALSTFRLTKGDQQPFSITMDNGYEIKDKRSITQSSQDKSRDPQAVETATASLIDGASRRFGADKIAQCTFQKKILDLPYPPSFSDLLFAKA